MKTTPSHRRKTNFVMCAGACLVACWLAAGCSGSAAYARRDAAQGGSPAQESASDDRANGLKIGARVIDENPAVAFTNWSPAAFAVVVPEGPNGSPCLRIRVPDGNTAAAGGAVQQDVMGKAVAATAGRFEISRALDLPALRGWRVKLVAHLRTAGVPRPAAPWDGVRIGMDFATPLFNYNSVVYGQPGDSDWHDAVLADTRIPEDAVGASVFVGLIAPAGTLWVDHVRVVLVEPPLTALAAKRVPFVQQTARRGAGIASATQAIAELAGEWKLNVIKWWFRFPDQTLSDEAYAAALDKVLETFDGVLRQAEEAGIKVILQAGPGAWSADQPRDSALGGTDYEYLHPRAAERFISSWKVIARKYAGRDVIEGYDLLNETTLRMPVAAGCYDWEGLAERAARAINEIDPTARLFVQPELWWGVSAFTRMRPIQARNVIYSIHMYDPFALTHQGVTERKSLGISYPSTINGKVWDKQALRRALQPARDFQLAYGVPMQVGEFSCIRWAPDGSRGRWLKDCIDLFEEYGWDWTYHALRDWDGWSPDLGEDPNDQTHPPQPDAARRVLLEAFARNPPAPIPVRSLPASSPVKKLLIIGNSIARHGPAPELGWTGNWGMAASTPEKDYVHLFLARLTENQGGVMPEISNGGGGGSTLADKLPQCGSYTSYGADLAIIQMGENGQEIDEVSFQRPYEQILQAIKDGNPRVRILCVGVWSPPGGDPAKDAMIRAACKKVGAAFADLSAANADPANRAGSEKRFTHAGVNWHPGDRGMQAYAEALWQAWTNTEHQTSSEVR